MEEKEEKDKISKIRFHYIKGNNFRVIHADGAYGGLSPTGDLFFCLFSQRPPIPTITAQQVDRDGKLGDEILQERVTKDGLVREIEVGVAMRPEIAEALIKFLQEKLDQYKKITEKQEQKDQVGGTR